MTDISSARFLARAEWPPNVRMAEAMNIGRGMKQEARNGKGYARMDFNIVTGKRPDVHLSNLL
jgi:hypothetical protein